MSKAPEITLTSEIAVRLIDSMGGDLSVVRAARVSTLGGRAAEDGEDESAEVRGKLISFLMRHRHGSPFEHGSLTFFAHAPIFVWREWHRHRIGFSYNEESGRYKELEPVFWVPRRRREMCPVPDWKPGRPKFVTLDRAAFRRMGDAPGVNRVADEVYARIVARKRAAYEAAYAAYLGDIADGVSFEVARSVLPVGIYSSCWVTTNPRALMHFLSLRTHDESASFVSYPQAEIEEAARVAESFLATGWPLTHKAFCDNGRVAP